MFALEVATQPLGTATLVKWYAVIQPGKLECLMWGIISAVVSIPGMKLSTPMQHHIQKSQRVSLEEICLDTLAYLLMLYDMRNYTPLTWGQHRLLSICAHWKNHMKSISPKLSVHTFFLYQYSLQASVSLFPHLSCHLSSTPPSVSTTQPSSLTHTHTFHS